MREREREEHKKRTIRYRERKGLKRRKEKGGLRPKRLSTSNLCFASFFPPFSLLTSTLQIGDEVDIGTSRAEPRHIQASNVFRMGSTTNRGEKKEKKGKRRKIRRRQQHSRKHGTSCPKIGKRRECIHLIRVPRAVFGSSLNGGKF